MGLPAVFLVLLAARTAQGLPLEAPGETLAFFRIGESSVPAVIDAKNPTVAHPASVLHREDAGTALLGPPGNREKLQGRSPSTPSLPRSTPRAAPGARSRRALSCPRPAKGPPPSPARPSALPCWSPSGGQRRRGGRPRAPPRSGAAGPAPSRAGRRPSRLPLGTWTSCRPRAPT